MNPKGYRNAHGSEDVRQAFDILSSLAGDNDILEAYWKLLDLQARAFVASGVHWGAIKHLAAALLERETMTGAEVRAAIREGYDRQAPKFEARTENGVTRLTSAGRA